MKPDATAPKGRILDEARRRRTVTADRRPDVAVTTAGGSPAGASR